LNLASEPEKDPWPPKEEMNVVEVAREPTSGFIDVPGKKRFVT
jgi:hypothetical protein